ncbi:rhodanese-like domain-containing protein [Campylobacter sp. 19-13652]|uniref:rhodanese-like domain-containing protein n=1 Tax=Campylobacter sp. 19-13652 TaxID=2840180 RepID=UPI001C79995D|nr:rhodanese-like domain-containing protein [Campylobacter sp. 19-13652]BCX78795.1 thiosulfate sulfurtransferase [Campylobacter sp. 19-13652]
MKKSLLSALTAALILAACSQSDGVKSITTAELASHLNDPAYVIIDARDDSLFNGFKENGAKRGGHVAGAVQFSSTWLGRIDDDKFISFAAAKGITKDKTLIIYDTDPDALARVAAEFKARGYKVASYDKFIEYANDESLPMQSYANYELAVSAKWLKARLDEPNPPKIYEVSWGSVEKSAAYLSHIVEAYHFDTDLIEADPVWNLRPLNEIRANLASIGIAADTPVVLYSANQLAALRVLFALKYAGVKDVRFLNGSIYAWQELGYPVETKVNTPAPLPSFGEAAANLNINVSMPDDVIKMQKSVGLKLVSNRSWDEYVGKISGYDYIPGKGEPAGAIWGFAGSDSSNVADYYDPDDTLRNPDEIFALWQSQGINSDDYVAFYCGTGWRASVSWFMTELAGWKHAYVYDGGWNAWQMHSRYPVQLGAPNGASKPDSGNDYGKVYKAGGSCRG